mgnify:CR=1 FL=1
MMLAKNVGCFFAGPVMTALIQDHKAAKCKSLLINRRDCKTILTIEQTNYAFSAHLFVHAFEIRKLI